MFKILRNLKTKSNTFLKKEEPLPKVIERIHKEFYSEVDKLLETALKANSLDTDKQELIDKCIKLKKLGFVNTKEIKEAEIEIKRLEFLKEENSYKIDLIESIKYFSFKYPNYKFITEESVSEICKKYGLIYGNISKYLGAVPDENLDKMENFLIQEKDECFLETEAYHMYGSINNKKFVSFDDSKKEKNDRTFNYYFEKCPLEIAAPIKDFDTKGMKIENYNLSKVEIPDPIVLKPVFFRDKKYFLIVTAWGLEASDEIVVNQKMN